MKDPWAQVISAARKKLLWGRFVSMIPFRIHRVCLSALKMLISSSLEVSFRHVLIDMYLVFLLPLHNPFKIFDA